MPLTISLEQPPTPIKVPKPRQATDPPRTATYRKTATAVFAGGVATFASLYSTQLLLPQLGARFHIDAGHAAWSLSAATWGMALGLIFSGPLSDRLGRTPLMRWSLLCTALLDILVVFTPNWPVLLTLRAAQGLALSCFPAAAAAYLREETAPERHARASGLYVGGTAIGGMVGRFAAAIGSDLGGWRVGLGAVSLVAVICAAVCWTSLPPSRGFQPTPPTARGGSLRTTLRLARDPVMVGLWLLGSLTMGGFVATFNVIGYRLENAPYHLSSTIVGFIFVIYALGSVASAWAGRAAERWGRPWVVVGSTALLLSGIAITNPQPLGWVIVGLIGVTCGFFATHGVASGWVAARAQPYGATGQASAIYLVIYYTGSSLAGAQAGVAWTGHGWSGVSLLVGGLASVALLVALLLAGSTAQRRRGSGTEPRRLTI